jgi:hypothetical protein
MSFSVKRDQECILQRDNNEIMIDNKRIAQTKDEPKNILIFVQYQINKSSIDRANRSTMSPTGTQLKTNRFCPFLSELEETIENCIKMCIPSFYSSQH